MIESTLQLELGYFFVLKADGQVSGAAETDNLTDIISRGRIAIKASHNHLALALLLFMVLNS
jgi:hypothetical protein